MDSPYCKMVRVLKIGSPSNKSQNRCIVLAQDKTWQQNFSVVEFDLVLSEMYWEQIPLEWAGMHSLLLDEHNNIFCHIFCYFESSIFTDKSSVAQATQYSEQRIVWLVLYIAGC